LRCPPSARERKGTDARRAEAVALFREYNGPNFTPTNYMAHKGVEWNAYVERWVMLCDCSDETPLNLCGI